MPVFYDSIIFSQFLKPIVYNDLKITFVELQKMHHSFEWMSTAHTHDYFELDYVSEGSLYTTIQGEEFKVEPTNFYLIPPSVTHSHRSAESTNNVRVGMRWNLNKIEMQKDTDTRAIADFVIDTLSRVQARCFNYRADWIFNYIDRTSPELTEAALSYWLMCIYRAYVQADEPTETIHEQKHSDIVSKVLSILHENYNTDLDVTEVAASLGYSYRHIARIFKETTAKSITEKLNNIRISKAMDLLQNTKIPIKDISRKVGFTSESYFSSVFFKYARTSPLLFRKEHRK